MSYSYPFMCVLYVLLCKDMYVCTYMYLTQLKALKLLAMYVHTFYIVTIQILDFCLIHPLVEILDLSHTLSSLKKCWM